MREIGCCQLGVYIPLLEFAEFPWCEDHQQQKRIQTSCISTSDNIPLRETDGLRAYVTKIHDPAASLSPRLSFINEYHNVGPSLKFPRHRIWIEKELGRGAFGRVLQGIALGIDSSEERKKVAVKTLKGNISDFTSL